MRDIDIWGGLLMYEYDQTDGILTEFAQLLEPVDRRAQVTGGTTDAQGKGAMSKHVMMTVSIGYAQQWNAKGAMASLKYTKPVTKSPRVFNGFKTLPTAGGEIRKMGLGQLMTEEGQFNGGELRFVHYIVLCLAVVCALRDRGRHARKEIHIQRHTEREG